MGGETETTDRQAAAALLGWWLESGVDAALSEEPRDWRQSARPLPPAEAVAELSSATPADFAAFRSWLEQAPGLPFDLPGAARVLPRGEPGAEVMLMTDMASVDDQGEPIGGDCWALTVKMLAAIAIEPGRAYLANLSCFSSPGMRIGGADAVRCAEIARTHVALAAPKRLVLFGDGPAKALLGGTVAQKRGKIHKVEGVRTIATFAPSWLLKRPADKALAWRDLLLLMEE